MASHLTLKKLFEFMRKIDELNISSEAKDLLIHYMTHQGESYVFHNDFIADQKGWSRQYFDRIKKELVTEGLITTKHVYENGKRAGTHVTVIYDLPDVTPPNVSKANVSNANVKKANVRKPNVSGANVSKSNVIESKKINREEENRREEEKAAVAAEGDRLSAPAGAAASEAAPAAAAAADSSSPEISHSQDKKPRQSSKASKAAAIPLSQNPPSQADVEAAVSQIAANSKIPGWTPEAIRFKAFTIWNHYELKQWKRADGTDATDLNSCVFCWMKRDGFKPPVMDNAHQQTPVPSSGLLPAQKTSDAAEKQKSFKQMQQEWIERPLTDPESCAVEDAAHLIFNARSEGEVQGVLNSIPVHLRERALALANEKRKEQGDRPRIISPLPYEEDDS